MKSRSWPFESFPLVAAQGEGVFNFLMVSRVASATRVEPSCAERGSSMERVR